MEAIYEILSQGVMITGFVMIMMLVIEYLNVLTRGNWDHVIGTWKIRQSLFCSFLGVTPGCLGAYAAGSFYIHRVIGLGALTAAMVATCGDESFIMLSLFPRTALYIFAALFAGGVITGVIIDLITKTKSEKPAEANSQHQTSHPNNPRCTPFSAKEFVTQWRNCSPQRGWLTLFLLLFLGGIISGTITRGHRHRITAENHGAVAAEKAGHHHIDQTDLSDLSDPSDLPDHDQPEEHHSSWNWLRITFLVLSLVALAIVATVPDHFLDEHLWQHLIKIHGWRILLWTTGALAVNHILVNSMEITAIVENHKLPILLISCLIGILPTSGPHIVFITLYASQTLPLSVLVANCIVQDGHGLLPTLAHSRKTFLFIKGIKVVIGLAIGFLGHSMGW